MKNVIFIIALLLAGGLGYWLGSTNKVSSDDKNLLKKTDFFDITPRQNLMLAPSKPIGRDSAKMYTSRYKALIDASVIVDGQPIRLRDILHPTPVGQTTFADYPYFRIEASTIKDILKEGAASDIKRLCIFPSIKIRKVGSIFRKEFTLVLIGEDSNNDLDYNTIYDEIDVCPPPKPCKDF